MSAKKKVLMIDDEESFCFLVQQNLQESGEFTVEFATDALKGINLAKKIRPDILLLDITMPKKSGLEVLEALKKDKHTMSVPVVMLSALSDDETKRKAAYLYGDDYLVKPVAFAALKEKIYEVLDRQQRAGA